MPATRAAVIGATMMAFFFLAQTAQAAETVGAAASLNLRCETYCSRTKLRTANVKITWIDPRAALSRVRGAAVSDVEQQLQTTVFKNGFSEDLFATFPALSPGPDAAPERALSLAEKPLRAYDLRIIGVARPEVSGEGAPDILRLSPEQQETSVIVENLEPGLTYYWRVRFKSNGDWQLSEPVMCEAPVCPADIQEER